MPEMIDGIPVCYGCIETYILRASWNCLRCAHVEGCKQYAENTKKGWEETIKAGE